MRLLRFLLTTVCIFALFALPAGAKDLKSFYTLDESIREAIANNWSLKAKEEKVAQALYAKKQARADFLPKLALTYGYTRLDEQKKSDPVSIGAGITIPGKELNSRDNYQLKLTVTQPVFTGFALLSSYELARLGIDRSKLEVAQEKLDLARRVKEAYFGILKADKALEVAKRAVESLESNVKVAQSFYKVGMIPVNDLLKAEVELANARQNQVKAANAARLARSTFNIVLSRPIDAPVDVEDVLGYLPERGEFEAYLQQALESRPEIQAIDVSIRQVDQQVRLARSKNFPEIALTYNYIREGDDPDVSGSEFHDRSRWEAMAVLSWELWSWGKTHYSVREKETLRRELFRTRSALVDGIRLELKDALLALDEAEKNIPTTKMAVEQGEENLRVNEERYKAQVTTITEVLDAQTLLTQARTNYYNALYDHHLARARLERALGILPHRGMR